MKLVRLAVIGLHPSPPQHPETLRIVIGGVEVALRPAPQTTGHGGDTQVITFATIPVGLPNLDAAKRVLIPDELRRECESAIDIAADLLALTSHCRRSVVCGTPPVALIPESDEDLALLARASVIAADPPRMLSTVRQRLGIGQIVPFIGDRINGVAMLAESYAHATLAGQYRDLVRFFEMGFAGSFIDLHKKLHQTLAPAMGYTVDEIQQWQRLRHPFSHADGKKTKEIALEADARPVVQRMEQAAFDILLNKAEWATWSSDRRDVWKPSAITTDRLGKGVIRQGSTGISNEFLLLDEFGRFPRVPVRHTDLPKDWWYRFFPEEKATPAPSSAAHDSRTNADAPSETGSKSP
jgi:hypothetical protein